MWLHGHFQSQYPRSCVDFAGETLEKLRLGMIDRGREEGSDVGWVILIRS